MCPKRSQLISVKYLCGSLLLLTLLYVCASPLLVAGSGELQPLRVPFRDGRVDKAFTWGNDVVVATGPVAGGISLTCDTSGNLYAARCSTEVSTTIFIYKSTDAGQSWSYLTQTGAPSGSLLHPVLLTGSNGDKLYLFNLYSSLNGSIRVLRYLQDGSWDVNLEVKVDSDTITYFSACSDMGVGDHLMVAYQKEEMKDDTPAIYTIVSADQGETWGDEYYITGDGEHPDIAYGNDGYVYLVYEKLGGGPDQEIGFIRSNNYCAPGSWEYGQFLTSDSYDDTYPKVAALHHALPTEAAVWVAYNQDWGDGNIDLYYAYSTDGGASWTKDRPLANTGDLDEMACDLWAKPDESYNFMSVCYLTHKITIFPELIEYSEVHRAYTSRSFPGTWYAGGRVSDSTAAFSADGREVCQGSYTGVQVCALYAGKTPSGNFENLAFDNGGWTDVENQTEEELSPPEFSLSNNYPNPFNPETKISYFVPKASHVRLEVFNILGRKIRTLVDEDQMAGNNEVTWDGRDDEGNEVASGIYLYKLEAGDLSQSRKMVLIR